MNLEKRGEQVRQSQKKAMWQSEKEKQTWNKISDLGIVPMPVWPKEVTLDLQLQDLGHLGPFQL